jgi:hypothetical protein
VCRHRRNCEIYDISENTFQNLYEHLAFLSKCLLVSYIDTIDLSHYDALTLTDDTIGHLKFGESYTLCEEARRQ